MVAKSRLARNLVSLSLYRSPTVPSSSSSHSPVNLRANCPALDSLRTGKLVAMDSNENSSSSSHAWHTDSVPNSSTEKLVARSKKEHHRSKFGPSQFDHNATQCRIYGQSSSHAYDRNLVVQRKTKWSGSTPTLLGEYL